MYRISCLVRPLQLWHQESSPALLQGEGCHVSSLSWTFSGQKVGEVGEGVEQILGEIRGLC